MQTKVVRHVRTSSGERRFGQPIGSIIVRDGLLLHGLTTVDSEFGNYAKVKDKQGRSFYIGKRQSDGKYEVLTPSDQVLHTTADEDDAYVWLAGKVGGGAGKAPERPAPPKKAPARKPPAKRTAAKPAAPAKRTRATSGKTKTPMHPMSETEKADLKKMIANPGPGLKGQTLPPAWTNLQIADDYKTSRKLLATGVDARGKTQYLYHAAWRESQNEKKHVRAAAVDEKMQEFDAQVDKDWKTNQDARVAMLVGSLAMRIGSEDAATSDNRNTLKGVNTYGASTLQARHVTVTDKGYIKITFRPGKAHQDHTIALRSNRIADMLRDSLQGKRGNDPLFPYASEAGVRAYVKKHLGDDVKPKDLRTRFATMLALQRIAAEKAFPANQTQYKKMRRQVAIEVAAALTNTPAVTLSSYIDPKVWDEWAKNAGVDVNGKPL